MPRRPVRQQDRQRVVRACDACKSSKKRCDGNKPCNGCKKKGHQASCHYTPGRRHCPLPEDTSGVQQISPTASSQVNANENMPNGGLISPTSLWEAQNSNLRSPRSVQQDFAGTPEHQDSENGQENDMRSSTGDTMGQPTVMLSSGGGEKVFVGNTASISFLAFLQKTLKRYAGPCAFTEAQESQSLFEANITDMGSSRFYDGLNIEDRITLIKGFLDASSGLLDLYSWAEISQIMDTYNLTASCSDASNIQNMNSLQVASLFLMVAIGAQCSGSSSDDVTHAAELFSCARKMALENMLESPSLDMVRAFLLMAFYMFGACRRNAAFMYLGVASKAGDILGLHMAAQQKYLSSEARNARLRTAKSLRVFDVVCNSILGRKSSTPAIRPGRTSYVDDDVHVNSETLYRALALGASYEVAAVLDTAVTKSTEGGMHTEVAEDLVLALQQRSRNFPSVLRHSDAEEDQSNRYVVLGNVHVSGAYYFSVILVTRHFLIQHVVPQLSEQANSPSTTNTGSPASPAKLKIAQLANACIEAATFMAQMCHQVMKSGNLIGNMCIVKAWLFAAGLVLGFSGLVEDERNAAERRVAFLKALHVLGALKRQSPQAEQYYNILSSFNLSIKAYRERQQLQRLSPVANLVDRVFLPNTMTDFDEADLITTQLPSPVITAIDNASADWQHELPLNSLDGMMPIDPALFGDNDIIARMLWESDSHAMDYANATIPGLL